MDTTRRHFLLAGASTLGACALSACKDTGPPVSELGRRLQEHFHYLSIPRETLTAFERARAAVVRGLPTDEAGWSTQHTRFLMSTDFFQNGEDPTRPLAFVAFYDPYVTPCYNPLMRH